MLQQMKSDTDDSNQKLMQEIKVVREMISTLMKMSTLSNQQSSGNAENFTSISDKNSTLQNFKFNKSNALFFFSKSVVSFEERVWQFD